MKTERRKETLGECFDRVEKEMIGLTEHEKLKEICDKIGYIPKEHGFEIDIRDLSGGIAKTRNGYQFEGNRDEREIIFTTEFMDKFFDYYRHSDNVKIVRLQSLTDTFNEGIMKNLDKPAEFLYNLIN